MTIEVNMSGSGTLGPVVPGWSVNEYATPVVIGSTAGGTGNVSFSAGARDDSLFVVNNTITTTETDLGQISGVVKAVSQTGLNVSVTHDSLLSKLDVIRDMPALGSSGMLPVVDLATQITGVEKRLAASSGVFYSLAGHSAGFDADGDLVAQTTRDGVYKEYDRSDGKFYPVYYQEQQGHIWGQDFSLLGGKVYAENVYGDCLSNDLALPVSRVAFKALLNGQDVAFYTNGLPDSSDISTGYLVSVFVDYSAEEITVTWRGRVGGVITTISDVESISGLDLDSEVAVFFEMTLDAPNTIRATICNTSDYSTTVTATVTAVLFAYYNTPWSITGNVRAVYRDTAETLSSTWVQEYEIDPLYVFETAVTLGDPVAYAAGLNVWEYVQDACAAFNKEVALVNDVIVVRDLATRVIDVTNIVGAPTVAPNMLFDGQKIDIEYTNSQNVSYAEIYNAREDSNRIISVGLDEVSVTKVEVSGTPAAIVQPTRSFSPIAGVGEYSIVDNNGLSVPDKLWRLWGGRLQVEISDTGNALDIIFTAPKTGTGGIFDGATPVYPGPWKLAYSAGASAEYAALSVIGYGVKQNLTKLSLQTGADPEKTSREVAKTVSNRFISKLEQAYDRGVWASNDASGPRVTLSGSLPASLAQGFGLVAGSRIYYRDSIYRITDVTIGNIALNFTAVRHVTVDDFNAVWFGKNISVHDLTWEGYDLSDQIIAPLRFIGDDEPVIMLLDVDFNPYYDFGGEPEISVFPDTDMNPYYELGGNLEGEDPVFLDTDANPYDGGDGYGS